MYTHDLFYLQQEWEAWLAPVYKQIQTTKLQVTQCTKYECEQVLFVDVFTVIPPRLSDPCNFITVSNPGTGADDAFVLKRRV